MTESPDPDRPDFDGIFRAHYDRLVRSLGVAVGDMELAADCVQEAFVRAYTRWNRISRYDDPVGWVRHVAMNRMRDEFRRDQRKERALSQLAAEPESIGDAPREPDTLVDTIAVLPPQQRRALALFYGEDLTVAEVARAMELSDGAVKYHLHAGREALKERVQ